MAMAMAEEKNEEEITLEEEEKVTLEEEEMIELNGGGGGVWIKDKKKILGRGGCATVYLARSISSSSSSVLHHQPPLIAVKSAPLWSDEHNLLLEESEILLELKLSPNIVQFLGECSSVDKEGNKSCNLCFEYAPGGSLHDRIRSQQQGGLIDDEMDVRCYTRSILEGLRHIHNQGFVHCDLKPQNILICHNNVAKIADFGLAVKRDPKLLPRIRNHYLYRGTHLYVAPEEIHSQSYHPISDIWGLGCIVLEMLTGTDPWVFDPKTNDRESIVRYIAATEDLPIIPENISPLARDFLSNCLVRDTELRWSVDMLMEHHFIYSIDEQKYVNDIIQKEKEEMEIENKKKKRKREAEKEELKKMKRCNHGIRRRCAEMAGGLNQKSMDAGGRHLGF